MEDRSRAHVLGVITAAENVKPRASEAQKARSSRASSLQLDDKAKDIAFSKKDAFSSTMFNVRKKPSELVDKYGEVSFVHTRSRSLRASRPLVDPVFIDGQLVPSSTSTVATFRLVGVRSGVMDVAHQSERTLNIDISASPTSDFLAFMKNLVCEELEVPVDCLLQLSVSLDDDMEVVFESTRDLVSIPKDPQPCLVAYLSTSQHEGHADAAPQAGDKRGESAPSPHQHVISSAPMTWSWDEISDLTQVSTSPTTEVIDAKLLGVGVHMIKFLQLKDSAELLGKSEEMKCHFHPNIVQIMGICKDPPAIIFEGHTSRSLSHMLHASKVKLSLQEKKRIVLDVCRALRFLHLQMPTLTELICLHGHFDSSSILLTEKMKAQLHYFNLDLNAQGELSKSFSLVPLAFQAPEVLKDAMFSEGAVSFLIGTLLWETMAGQLPHADTNLSPAELKAQIIEERRPGKAIESWGSAVNNLIAACWAEDPGQRPSLSDLHSSLESILKESANSLPDWLTCPITLELMTEPVVAPSGISYERSTLLEALRRRPIEPVTSRPCSPDDVRTNVALRGIIQEYEAGHVVWK